MRDKEQNPDMEGPGSTPGLHKNLDTPSSLDGQKGVSTSGPLQHMPQKKTLLLPTPNSLSPGSFKGPQAPVVKQTLTGIYVPSSFPISSNQDQDNTSTSSRSFTSRRHGDPLFLSTHSGTHGTGHLSTSLEASSARPHAVGHSIKKSGNDLEEWGAATPKGPLSSPIPSDPLNSVTSNSAFSGSEDIVTLSSAELAYRTSAPVSRIFNEPRNEGQTPQDSKRESSTSNASAFASLATGARDDADGKRLNSSKWQMSGEMGSDHGGQMDSAAWILGPTSPEQKGRSNSAIDSDLGPDGDEENRGPKTKTSEPAAPIRKRRVDLKNSRIESRRIRQKTASSQPISSWWGRLFWLSLSSILVAAGYTFVVSPKMGTLLIKVLEPNGANVRRVEIFIDGTKRCEASPCKLFDLRPAVHEVTLWTDEQDRIAPQEVEIKRGQESVLYFTTSSAPRSSQHVDSNPDKPKDKSQTNITGMKAKGPAPLHLYVNGTDKGSLPVQLNNLAPGNYHILLTDNLDPKKRRYAAVSKDVILNQGQMLDLGDQEPEVILGKATIDLATPGALVFFVSAEKRIKPISFPLSMDIAPSKHIWIEASKPGFEPYKEAFTFEAGHAEKQFRIELKQLPGSRLPTHTTSSALSSEPKPSPTVSASQIKPGAGIKPGAQPATSHDDKTSVYFPEDANAFFEFTSIPPASVFLNGRPVGNTPTGLVGVKPGVYTAVFLRKEEGLRKELVVTAKLSETTSVAVNLRE